MRFITLAKSGFSCRCRGALATLVYACGWSWGRGGEKQDNDQKKKKSWGYSLAGVFPVQSAVFNVESLHIAELGDKKRRIVGKQGSGGLEPEIGELLTGIDLPVSGTSPASIQKIQTSLHYQLHRKIEVKRQ